jgi:DNA transformation protein
MVAKSPRASATAALQAHALELLSCLGDVSARRMFGGAGLFLDGRMLALIAGEVLHLKADAQAQPAFAAAGCQPFSYATKDGPRVLTSYWTAPDEAMESPAQMRPWALLALDSALRAAAASRQAAPRRPQASKRQPKASTPGAGSAVAAKAGKSRKAG